MNEFSLYRMANIDAKQMVNPMKQTALMLGFIKGPNVKDWVKRWTNWTLREFNMGTLPTSEQYWNTVSQAFQQAFIDSSARE